MATVSSHILDSVLGGSAVGIRAVLCRLDSETERATLFDIRADVEGRIAEVIGKSDLKENTEYELIFHAADYFERAHTISGTPQNMKTVVVRFSMPDVSKRYHIPIMLSPHSYSVWWSK